MNERELFVAALGIDNRNERSQFLNTATAGDKTLLRRVETLLNYHDVTTCALDQPLANIADLLNEQDVAESSGMVDPLNQSRDNSGQPNPPKVTIDEFLNRLRASKVLESTDFDLVHAKVTDFNANAEPFVRQLHKDKTLTKYQAQVLWKNKGQKLSFGNYIIEAELGRGGMGVVLKAHHKRMKRHVGIKVLPSKLVKNPDAIARFQREVEVASQLMHPNIVSAFDADEIDGQFVFIMEFVDGSDLSSIVRRKGPFSIAEAIDCVKQAAAGLDYAHRRGVVHRDIKPANLLLDQDGTVKILDMGLARFSDDADVETQADLTGSSIVMGTVDYMSPEQALSSKSAGPHSDQYSLGITLFFLLTGKTPYTGDSLTARLLAHRESPIPSLREIRADVSESLQQIFERMVAKQADVRFESMADVIDALDESTQVQSTTVRTNFTSEDEVGDDYGSQEVTEDLHNSIATKTYLGSNSDADLLEESAFDVSSQPYIDKEQPTQVGAAESSTFPFIQVSPPSGQPLSDHRGFPLRFFEGRNLAIFSGVFALLVASIVLYFRAPGGGTLRIEITDPNIEVTVKGTKIVLKGATDKKITLEPGELVLHVKRGDFQFDTDTLILKEGGTVLVKAELFEGVPRAVRNGVIIGQPEVEAPSKTPSGDNPSPSPGKHIASPSSASESFALAFNQDWKPDDVDHELIVPSLKDTTPSMTMEFWTLRGPTESHSFIMGFQQNYIGLTQVKTGSSPFLSAGWRMNEVPENPPTMGTKTPVHVALVRDAERGEHRFYVDGKRQRFLDGKGSTKWVDAHKGEADQRGDAEFRICGVERQYNGTLQNGGPRFIGWIDEIRISDTPRYVEDFTPSRRFQPDKYTRALYHFDDGQGQAPQDASGNGHHAKLTGAKWVRVNNDSIEAPSRTLVRPSKWASWTAPVNLGPTVNSHLFTKTSSITDDGLSLYFVSENNEGSKLWRATRKSTSEPFGSSVVVPVEGEFQLGTVGPRGLRFCFTSLRPGGHGKADVWVSRRKSVDETFVAAKNLGAAVNTADDDYASLSRDGLTVLVMTKGRLSIGTRPSENVPFKKVVPLNDEINSSRFFQFSPILSSDGMAILFTRDFSKQQQDLWIATRSDTSQPFGKPTRLPTPINTDARESFPFLSNDGLTLYFKSDREPGGIWMSRRVPPPAVAPFDSAAAKAHQEAWATYLNIPVEKTVELGNGVQLAMVLIPPGKFLMGSSDTEKRIFEKAARESGGRFAVFEAAVTGHEVPQHAVKITEPFYLSKYEFSQSQWRALTGENPSVFGDRPANPVENISHQRISKFIDQLNERRSTGERFALPTEAQWEFACRAGTTNARYCEDSELSKHAWFRDNAPDATRPCGQLRPNPFGLHDMLGNVWEWVADGFEFYSDSDQTDPRETIGPKRIVRGGCWGWAASGCRSALRNPQGERLSFDGTGFRLVLTIEPERRIIETSNVSRHRPPSTWPLKPTDPEVIRWLVDVANAAPIVRTGKDEMKQLAVGSPLPKKPATVVAVDIAKPDDQLAAIFDRVVKLVNLESLKLGADAKMSVANAAQIAKLQNLRGLDLTSIRPETGVESCLERLPFLQSLALPASGADVWAQSVANHPGITSIRATNSDLTAEGITSLESVYGLKTLLIAGCPNVTRDSLKQLVASNPLCTVIYDGKRISDGNSPPAPATAPFDAGKAKMHQEAWAKYLGKTVVATNSTGMKFVLIPPGTFTMGAPQKEIKRLLDLAPEKFFIPWIRSMGPQHEVILTKPFQLGMHEVTQSEWQSVMGNSPTLFSPTGPMQQYRSKVAGLATEQFPVEYITWYEAVEFCNRLSAKEGLPIYYQIDGETVTSLGGTGYRLPTEAEWEFACRAGTTTSHGFGSTSEELDNYAWHEGNSGEKPHSVGGLRPNAFGLYDMHGNVTEWCWDRAGPYPDSAAINPDGATFGDRRITRGESWYTGFPFLSSGFRVSIKPDNRNVGRGLRVARTISPRPAVAPFDADEAKAHQLSWAKSLGEPIVTTNSIGVKLAVIPPGEYSMGPDNESVDVTLTQPIRLGVHEVTQSQWRAVMGTEPWKGQPFVKLGDNTAATYVSWVDIAKFCQKLTEQERATGRLQSQQEYRLPTEAEWEFACRAGTTTTWSFGDDETKLGEYAWHSANAKDAGEAYPHVVGLKKPNRWGLFDMHGNVYEWCLDGGGKELIGGNDPVNPFGGNNKRTRGGDWFWKESGVPSSRTIERDASKENVKALNLGFRIVMTFPLVN